MKQFYDTFSFVLFLFSLALAVLSTMMYFLTFVFPEDAPFPIILYYFIIPIAFSCIGIAILLRDHPPIKQTERLLNKFGYDKYLAWKLEKILIKNKWKYRIGDRVLKINGDTVEIVGYDQPERARMNMYYHCLYIKSEKFPWRVGYIEKYHEDNLSPIYKFDVNDYRQLFGFVGLELRKYGILKTQT